MIAILLKIKNYNLVLIPRWVRRSRNLLWNPLKGFCDLFFCEKKSENPSQFVEGIILDDDVTTTESDNNMANDFSGFDLVMGLGASSKDNGLDLVRGDHDSSDDDENRRLRKLNQDSLTTVEKI